MKSFFQFLSESAAQQAERLGLEGDGHGGWYDRSTKEFVAKTEKGRLKFYNKRQQVGKDDPDQTELEKNISNNRYSFSTKLKNEQLDIALISGSLNYNSRAIISKINNNFDHFFPTIDSHVHNFEDFWFKKYDIVIFDNFPKMPISDRWFNLFIKKIYSENTSLITVK